MTLMRRMAGSTNAAPDPGDATFTSGRIRKVYVSSDIAYRKDTEDAAGRHGVKLAVYRDEREIQDPVDGDVIFGVDHAFVGDYEPLVRLGHRALEGGHKVGVQTYYEGHPALAGLLSRSGVVVGRTFEEVLIWLLANSASALEVGGSRA